MKRPTIVLLLVVSIQAFALWSVFGAHAERADAVLIVAVQVGADSGDAAPRTLTVRGHLASSAKAYSHFRYRVDGEVSYLTIYAALVRPRLPSRPASGSFDIRVLDSGAVKKTYLTGPGAEPRLIWSR